MAEKCRLCGRIGSNGNPIVTHHIQGRKKGVHMPVMRVHDQGCHAFCNWLTQEFQLRGVLGLLTENIVVYFYGRASALRRDPTYGWG